VLVVAQPGISRARAADLIWPESVNPRRALRQQLLRLRRVSGTDLLVGDDKLHLNSGVQTRTLAQALLSAHRFDECEEFDAWLRRQQQQQSFEQRQDLQHAADEAEQRQDYAAALLLTQRLLADEPDSEAHYRRLIRQHYLNGDTPLALQAYEQLGAVLARRGAIPAAETRELIHTVRESMRAPAVHVQAPQGNAAARMPVSVLRPPRLIGRAEHWAELRAALAQDGVVWVHADPGMGKSRLLNELAREHAAGAIVGARPGDTSVPYALLSRLARSWVNRPGLRLAQGVTQELARLLPELGSPLPADDNTTARFMNALTSLLDAAMASGLREVLLDDLQYADDASLQALTALMLHSSALPWCVAFRSAEQTPALSAIMSQVARLRVCHVIELQPLTTAQIEELIDSLGLQHLDPIPLARNMARAIGGNPMYALEAIKGLIHSGSKVDSGLPQIHGEGLDGFIGRRLATLSAAALRLVRCAAVSGQDFSLALASSVLECHPIDLSDAWRELEQTHVFRDGLFAHDLIFETALAAVPAQIARDLHRRVAQHLSAQHAPAARVAHHWLQSDEPQQGIEALVAAAGQAQMAARNVEAADFLSKASDLSLGAGDSAQAFTHALGAVRALVLSPDQQRHQQALQRVTQLAGTVQQRAQAGFEMAQALNLRGEQAAYRAAVEQTLTMAIGCGEHEVESRCRLALAVDNYREGRISEAVQQASAALQLAERLGDAERTADAQAFLGISLESLGHIEEARRVTQCALDEMQRQGRQVQYAQTLGFMAFVAIDTGQAGRMREEVQRMMQLLSADSTNALHRAIAANAYSEVFRRLGEYGKALATAEALPRVRDEPLSPGHVQLMVERARLYADLGRPDLAYAELRIEDGQLRLLRWRQQLLVRVRLAELAREYGTAPTFGIDDVLRDSHTTQDSTASVADRLARLEEPMVRAMLLRACNGKSGDAELLAQAEREYADSARLGLRAFLPGLAGVAAAHAHALGRADVAQRWIEHAIQQMSENASFDSPAQLCAELHKIACSLSLPDLASQALAFGRRWVAHVRESLPSPFLHSFTERQPAVRYLLRKHPD
jgi:DNA-binding SARP family transcriptional activator